MAFRLSLPEPQIRAMERRSALFLILCFHVAPLICAASSRNDARARQQMGVVAELSVSQKQSSLLTIMKGLEHHRPLAAVAMEVQVQRRALSSAHEHQLLKDMGRLEHQLESWRSAEQNLERQVAQQGVTVKSLRAEEAKAIHDEQIAAVVWWDGKMLMCIVLAAGLGSCIYMTSPPDTKMPSPITADAIPAETRRARAQTEFVEKDAQPEVEDTLQITLPARPSLMQTADIEAPVAKEDVEKIYEENLEGPIRERASSEQCQYFNLAEESSSNLAEQSWWDESTAGY